MFIKWKIKEKKIVDIKFTPTSYDDNILSGNIYVTSNCVIADAFAKSRRLAIP